MTGTCTARRDGFGPARSVQLRSAAAFAFLALGACGGGGSSRPSPTPAPPPTVTPSPTPTPVPTPTPSTSIPTPAPVPTAFNTREFRDSDGPLQHNAASAWSAGHTGQGVTIAIVDTGIDQDSPEFAGRIVAGSRDIYTQGRALTGPDDHGTNVALVAAGARNNTGVLGIAYDANILAIRADQPGTCGGDNPEDSATECSFSDSVLADAVDYAVAQGAKVVNLSLGGPGAPGTKLRNSVSAAVSAGVLVVVAAGNDGLTELDQFGKALVTAGSGGVIAVGSIDEDYAISSFSNRAGSDRASYIVARGETICCTYKDGQLYVDAEGFVYLFSGTSFAAPQVSGAAALLAQAFPNLTGQEIAEILIETAFDLGARGDDATYGSGMLDIRAAFQPIGATALAGEAAPLALGDSTGASSPAMGDAIGTASLPTLVTDKYDRAFRTDLAGTLGSAQVPDRLHNALQNRSRQVAAGNDTASVAFSIASPDPGRPVDVGDLRLTGEQGEQARVLAARVALKLSGNAQFGFTYGESASGLTAQMRGADKPAFMVASDAAGDDGTFRSTDASVAVRRSFGPWGVTASAERGETWSGAVMRHANAMQGRRLDEDVTSFALTADRRFGALDTVLGVTLMQEDRTLLGGRFHDAFGLTGADTLFVDAEAGWHFADDWRLGASLRQGFSRARGGGRVADGSELSSRAWSLDLHRRGVFDASDAIAFRVSQPLRVESGGLNLSLPSHWNYDTETADYTVQTLSLSPQGRELNGEFSWRGSLFGGSAAASLFYRKDPGHYRALPADTGVALRWNGRF